MEGIRGNDGVVYTNHGALIGGFITLDELSRLPLIRGRYPVPAEAAESVGTPQIRNAGTLAGNVCQRPWCWYYGNDVNRCFSVGGENQFHAIFGGGPSFIANPSDTAPALVAQEATFRVIGPPPVNAWCQKPSSSTCRASTPNAKTSSGKRNPRVHILAASEAESRSNYQQILDREAWTHAVASAAIVLEMDGETFEPAPAACWVESHQPVSAGESGGDAGRPANHAGTGCPRWRSRCRRCEPSGQKTPIRCL